MSYAAAAARYRPALRGQQRPATINPLRHLAHIEGLSLLIDLRSVLANTDKKQRADFVIDDLKVPAEDVRLAYVDGISQLFICTVATEEVYNEALEKLKVGVPWTLAEGRLVYGSSSSETITSVRVSSIPIGVPHSMVVNHMKQFGTVLSFYAGRDRCFPKAGDGILHLRMVLHDADRLPHYIEIKDENQVVSHALAVHMDTPRRRCYRCGRANHFGLGYRCQAAVRAPDVPDTVWSTMQAPPAPKGKEEKMQQKEAEKPEPMETPKGDGQQPQAAEAAITTNNKKKEEERIMENADKIIVVSAEVYTAPETPKKDQQSPANKEGGKAAVVPATPGKKRPPSSLPLSSSSERERSLSPEPSKKGGEDPPFTTVPVRGRNKRKKKLESGAAAAEAAKRSIDDDVSLFKVPLAAARPRPSELEDLILTPGMEVEGDDPDGGGGE